MLYVIIHTRDFVCLLKEQFYSGISGHPWKSFGIVEPGGNGCVLGLRALAAEPRFLGKVGWLSPSRAERDRVGQPPGWAPGPPPRPGGPKPPSALILQLFPNPKHDSRPRPTRGISENESRGIRLCFGEAPQLPPLGAAGKRSWERRHHIPPG